MIEATNIRLQQAACHESGHALAARWFDMPLVGVMIDPVDGSGMVWGPRGKPSKLGGGRNVICAEARTIMPDPWEGGRADATSMLTQAHTRVIQLVAGSEAERLFFPDEPLLDAAQDQQDAEEFAHLVCTHPNAVAGFIGYARVEARELLNTHRLVVELITEALLQKLSMTCAEVDAIIVAALAREDLAAERKRRIDWAKTVASALAFEACHD